MVQDAVTRNLQGLAESTRRLSDGLKADILAGAASLPMSCDLA